LEQEKGGSSPNSPKSSLKHRISRWKGSSGTGNTGKASAASPEVVELNDVEEEHQPHPIFSIQGIKSFIEALFDEDADRETRTLKYSILICVIIVYYSLLVRYCSFDLFLVIVAVLSILAVKVVVDRKKYILYLVKRKMKKVKNQKKRQLFGWMTPSWAKQVDQVTEQTQTSNGPSPNVSKEPSKESNC